jgi:uncharacterized membrane protein YdjX (TVP38/TMEM64 family)
MPRPLIFIAIGIALMPFFGLLLEHLESEYISQLIEAILPTSHGVGLATFVASLVIQVLIAASGIMPASLLAVAAGAIYGVEVGFLLAALCTLAGAMLSLWLSRSLFRPAVARLLPEYPVLHNIEELVSQDGWKLVCLLRLSPLMPFAATSFALGFSSVKRGPYLIGTLFSLPSLFGYVMIGQSVGAMSVNWHDGLNEMRLALLGVGGIASILAMSRVGNMVWRASSLAKVKRRS